jgi:CubicO group peptidase (beta-lactamase class C family)
VISTAWLSRSLAAALLALTPAAAPEPSAAPTASAAAAPLDFSELDQSVEAGIKAGVYPGAVIVVGRSDRILYQRGYGHLTWNRNSPRPSPDSTIWDLASLTKVIGTASATMRLVDRGVIGVDTPVQHYLPRFRGKGKSAVTVRMLLAHTSGLRPYLPLFRLAKTRQGAIDRLYAEPLQHPAGTVEQYSDLNAILLGLVLESVTGKPLDQVVETEVLKPLDLNSTMYRPPRSLWPRVAPASLWRGHPIRGEVNDPNAARLGGVSGHAGLFGTGHDIAMFARTWLRGGVGPHGQWVRTSTLKRFITSPNDLGGTRLLGWDSPDTTATPRLYGRTSGPDTFGHTGWTGTELWIDPAHDLYLVFLTNRSFDPKVSQSLHALREIRANVSDAALAVVPPVCVEALVAEC